MDIGSIVAGALPELRHQAESLMTLTLEAFEPTSQGWVNVDGVDQFDTTSKGTTVGRVEANPTQRTVSIGGVDYPIVDSGLHLPIGAFVVDGELQIYGGQDRGEGWEFVVTAVGALDAPELLGRRFLITSAPMKSSAVIRRLDVVDITGGGAA